MGFFDSKSSSRHSSVGADTDVVTGDLEDSSILSLGAVSTAGKYGQTHINVSTTDHGAIAAGYNLAAGSLNVVDDVVTKAMASADTSRTEGLMFGAGAMQAALEHASAADARATAVQQQAAVAVQKASQRANELVAQGTRDSLTFAAGAYQTTLAEIDESHEQALQAVGSFAGEAIQYTAEQSQSTMETLTTSVGELVDKTRSETASMTEKMMMYGLGGIALVVVGNIALKAWRK